MRLLQKIGLVLSCTIYSFSLIAQENYNSIVFSHGSIVSKIEDYSPTWEIAYYRTIREEFKVGVAFHTYQYHHITHYEDLSNKSDYWYTPEIKSNCIFLELGYNKQLLHYFSINPYLRIGSNNCKVKYIFKNDTTEYIKQKESIPTFVGGISTIFIIQKVSFSLSYDYSLNIRKDVKIFDGPFTDFQARPNRFFDFKHSSIKISVGYRF